jgi:formyl-CoA transferase
VRVGVSIGDTLASLHGVIGILLALQARHQTGQGQIIDIALYEAVFNCMESLLPEYSAFGEVRQAGGSALPGIAPSNAYRCVDGGYVLIAGNGDSIFKRLMGLIDRTDLANDSALANNDGRVARVAELDQAIGTWAKSKATEEALQLLDSAAVPAGKIYTVADIANDPHYKARGNIQTIQMRDGSKLDVPGVIPNLSRTPGSIKTLAPDIGENTDEILRSIGLTDAQLASLKERGIAFTK